MSAVLEAREPSARYLEAVQPALVRQFELLATASGGVTRLREVIVLLALQGRLVEQDPQDDSVLKWLSTIQPERHVRMTRGRAKTPKSLPPVDECEQWFDLPAAWRWVRLNELVTASEAGWSPSCPETPRQSGRWGVLKVSAVSWGKFDPDANKELPHELAPRPEYEVQTGDFLLSRANTADLVARSVVVDEAPPNLMLSDKIIRLTFPSTVNRAFINLCNNSAVARRYYAANASGTSSSMKNVSRDVVLGLPIPIPPVAEQAHIVARVNELMRLCDALEAKGRLEAEQHARLLGTLLGTLTDSSTPEELAANWQRFADHFDLLLDRPEAVDALEQTILQLAVRGLLVPQDPSDTPATLLIKQLNAGAPPSLGKPAYELPGCWSWARFDQVAEIASNLVSPAAHLSAWQVAPDCIEKGTGQLLHRRTVAEAGVKSANHRFVAGQILYSKIRPSLSKAVFVGFDGLCSADMYPINSRIDPQYLLMYILSQPFLAQVIVAENRVKMPKLNQEALNGFLIAIPPLEEQARIVARVTELRHLCADLRQRLTAIQTTQSHLAEALVDLAIA